MLEEQLINQMKEEVRKRIDAEVAQVNSLVEEIKQTWDWNAIKLAAMHNPQDPDSDGQVFGTYFLGTVFSVMPSGKFYTAWACSNVSPEEAKQDELYWEALEAVAEEYGLCIQSAEGDPCDLIVYCLIEEGVD